MKKFRINFSNNASMWAILAFFLLAFKWYYDINLISSKAYAYKNEIKLEVTNIRQLQGLCKFYAKTKDADGYSFHLLQPKVGIKTYKECVGHNFKYDDIDISYKTSINVPVEYINIKKDGYYEYKLDNYIIYVIPIYKYENDVAELHLYYKNRITSREMIEITRHEVQTLGRLIE